MIAAVAPVPLMLPVLRVDWLVLIAMTDVAPFSAEPLPGENSPAPGHRWPGGQRLLATQAGKQSSPPAPKPANNQARYGLRAFLETGQRFALALTRLSRIALSLAGLRLAPPLRPLAAIQSLT